MPFAALVSLQFPLLLTGLRQLASGAKAFRRQIKRPRKINGNNNNDDNNNNTDFRSGEVDRVNIDDSCRQFLSKVALLNTMLPVHFIIVVAVRGGKRQRAGPILLRGEWRGAEHP